MSQINTTVAVSLETQEMREAPLQPDQEWANALTHGLGAAGTVLLGVHLVSLAWDKDVGLGIACFVYILAVFGTFLCSTLSHAVLRQPLLNTFRAWDQAMIYGMISGTYTPIVYVYAPDSVRMPLLVAIWIAAVLGFLSKVGIRHRVNASGTISYLMLGWMPAVPLIGNVSTGLAFGMITGGVIYSIGVLFLINDSKVRYLHAAWHVSVMLAAVCHYLTILRCVVVTA